MFNNLFVYKFIYSNFATTMKKLCKSIYRLLRRSMHNKKI